MKTKPKTQKSASETDKDSDSLVKIINKITEKEKKGQMKEAIILVRRNLEKKVSLVSLHGNAEGVLDAAITLFLTSPSLKSIFLKAIFSLQKE